MKPLLSEKLVAACTSNPILVVLVGGLSIAALVVYVAGEIARSSPNSFTMFVVLAVAVLIYSGYLTTLALRHWGNDSN
jgi:hypothetical protein